MPQDIKTKVKDVDTKNEKALFSFNWRLLLVFAAVVAVILLYIGQTKTAHIVTSTPISNAVGTFVITPTSPPTPQQSMPQLTKCIIPTQCGGGVEYLTKDECLGSTCCTVGSDSYFMLSESACQQLQTSYNELNSQKASVVSCAFYRPLICPRFCPGGICPL